MRKKKPYCCEVCGKTDKLQFYLGAKNICKEHYAARVRKNRLERIEQYTAYERARAMAPHRVAAREKYQLTDAGKASVKKAQRKYAKSAAGAAASRRSRLKYPVKYFARTAVGNALRDGAIVQSPCEVCGTKEKVHAHHDDYFRPLDVRWLCVKHHAEHHRNNPTLAAGDDSTEDQK